MKDTYNDIYKAFQKCDEKWIQRKRKINTASLFNTLVNCCTQGRGVNHILRMDNENFSSQAIHSARKKLPKGSFKEVNNILQKGQRGPRVFAIDGSKVHVHPSFLESGYKTRTNDKPVSRPAKRPLIMLSSMVDVKSNECVDFEITKHFNERTSAKDMLRSVKKKDTLVFDRGYYSSDLMRSVHETGGYGVFRLKINAFKGVRSFFNSPNMESKCFVSGIKCKVVKYFIEGKRYVCLTNKLETTRREIKKIYASRWRVEESFKRLKSNLRLEKSHARTPDLYIQEIEARILLDTLTLRTKLTIKEPSYLYTLDTTVRGSVKRVRILSDFKGYIVNSRTIKETGKEPPRFEPGSYYIEPFERTKRTKISDNFYMMQAPTSLTIKKRST